MQRKSKSLKVIEGTYRPDRDHKSPQVEGNLGDPPKGLPPKARAFWKEISPQLERMGITGRVDRSSFERLCRLHALLQDAEAELAEEGFTAPDRHGSTKKSPILTVYLQLLREYRELSKCFGLNPLGRQRLDVTPARSKEEDDFIRWLMDEDEEWDQNQ